MWMMDSRTWAAWRRVFSRRIVGAHQRRVAGLATSLGLAALVASIVLSACAGSAGPAAQQEKAKLDQELGTARTTYNVPDGLLQPIVKQENSLFAGTASGTDSSYQAATAGYRQLYTQVVAIEQMTPQQALAQTQSDMQTFTTSLQQVQSDGFSEATQYQQRLQQAKQQVSSAVTTKDFFTVDGFVQAQAAAVSKIEPVYHQLQALNTAVDAQNKALNIVSPTPQPLQCARGDAESYFVPDPTVNVIPQAAQGQPSYTFQQWPAQDLVQFRAAGSARQYDLLTSLIVAQTQQLAADAATAAPTQAYNVLQSFQTDVQNYQQYGGKDGSFQQQATQDIQKLNAAKTLADFTAFISQVQKQRQAMTFPLLKAQTQHDFQTLQSQVDKAQSLKTIDPANNLPYPDGYEYASAYTGIGDASQRLANAQTQDDYQVIDEEIQMMLTNIQAMLTNLNDQTPSDQPHQTDYALLQHYGIDHTRVMVVSLREQEARMYDSGKFVKAIKVTTGNPDLPSPVGVHCISVMMQNYDDISPFPKDSPYYYNPTHINFGMVYSDYGYIVHDAWWRSWFGKYSNLPHYDPISFNNGSHGCVNLPLSDMSWLFQWGNVGMPVLVY
jgi:hypothetical protein